MFPSAHRSRERRTSSGPSTPRWGASSCHWLPYKLLCHCPGTLEVGSFAQADPFGFEGTSCQNANSIFFMPQFYVPLLQLSCVTLHGFQHVCRESVLCSGITLFPFSVCLLHERFKGIALPKLKICHHIQIITDT